MKIAALGQAMHGLTGEERGTRRCARWRGREGVQEQRAFAGDAVECRRRNSPVPVRTRMRERPVVGNGKQDVRPCFRQLRRPARRGTHAHARDARNDEEECDEAEHGSRRHRPRILAARDSSDKKFAAAITGHFRCSPSSLRLATQNDVTDLKFPARVRLRPRRASDASARAWRGPPHVVVRPRLAPQLTWGTHALGRTVTSDGAARQWHR